MSVEPTVHWIAERLAVDRLSQRDLADALGINPSAITRMLKGQRRLRPEEIPLVHAFFSDHGSSTGLGAPRLTAAFSLPGVSLATVAGRSGIDVQRLLEIKHGRGRMPTQEELSTLGEVFGTDVAGLLSSEPLDASERETMRNALRMSRPEGAGRIPGSLPARRTIPVHGAPAPSGRNWYGDLGPVVEWREPPPALRDVPGSFGVYVGTDRLSPMLLRGDRVFVHPSRPAKENERVLARLTDARHVFGILEGRYVAAASRWDSEPLDLESASGVRIMPIVAIDFS